MTTPHSGVDPSLASWVEAANDPATDFPIQNLPFGVFTRRGSAERARVGVAIGDQVLDVAACGAAGLFDDALAPAVAACAADRLNALMAQGRGAASRLRAALGALLLDRGEEAARARRAADRILVPMSECELHAPAAVGDYTDFYASIHHARNVGSMFRPDHPLLPNYTWVPIGYHGRASSIVPSGAVVRRPWGQRREGGDGPPTVAASRRLDYELEVGAFIAAGNELGAPVPIGQAEEHVFGLCLVNDWSARDIQAWEYQPLGPFLAKSFATTVSPWVVTLDALVPFRIPAAPRSADDPAPLPYLRDAANEESGGIDLSLEVWLSSERMRESGQPAMQVSRGSFRNLYWTLAQLVAHHTSNGCNLRSGDLLASGTVSGPTPESRGCLLERTWRGTEPLRLPTGETRAFLEDGDEVVFRGYCERDGARRIGFGTCTGRVAAAHAG